MEQTRYDGGYSMAEFKTSFKYRLRSKLEGVLNYLGEIVDRYGTSFLLGMAIGIFVTSTRL